jgi:hypothetical protein
LTKELLRVFGEASGLVTNIGKCSITPIRCSDQVVEEVQGTLGCNVVNFPCKYLGLPLSHKKLTAVDLLPLIDKIADKLPGWKAALMHPAGRNVLVKAVLTAIPIHHLMVLQCPKWVLKAIDKIRRGFLWKGRRDIRGGHCLVNWGRVCRPIELGGLGIHNLEALGWSLCMRWLWFKKTQLDRPWTEFDIQVHPIAAAMFAASVVSIVGDGANTLFWQDRWIQGHSLSVLAPSLCRLVPSKFKRGRTVQEALVDGRWVRDIRGVLDAQVLSEYLQLWDVIETVNLAPGVSDQHLWTPSSSGQYSSRSAYRRFFIGSIAFEPAHRIWKSWAPPKCKFFLWLASLNRCWTADRLARRGLDHPDCCVLCNQEEETIQHLLAGCVFSRQVWFQVLSACNLQHLCPSPGEDNFQVWWQQAEQNVPKQRRKVFNSVVCLVAWWLWKHRNCCVFDDEVADIAKVVQEISEDATFWRLAGAPRAVG